MNGHITGNGIMNVVTHSVLVYISALGDGKKFRETSGAQHLAAPGVRYTLHTYLTTLRGMHRGWALAQVCMYIHTYNAGNKAAGGRRSVIRSTRHELRHGTTHGAPQQPG